MNKNKTHLGFGKRRSDLTAPIWEQGFLSVSDQNENKIEPVDRGPSKLEQALDIGKKIAIVLVLIAGSLLGLHVQGTLVLPATLVGILTAITGIGGALGIASSGTAKPAIGGPKGPPAE